MISGPPVDERRPSGDSHDMSEQPHATMATGRSRVVASAATTVSVADGIARSLLRLEDTEPRALVPIRGSLAISAVRCLLAYVLVPIAGPLIGLSGVVARPVSVVLSVAAATLALMSLRRVWAAEWKYRWAYTAFSLVVLALLTTVVVIDLRAVLNSTH